MTESISIDRLGMYKEVNKDLSQDNRSNSIKTTSRSVFNALFDSAEKCQMAIDAIRSGKLGATSQYSSLLNDLESKMANEFSSVRFDVAQRQKMNTGWDYVVKELDLVLGNNAKSKKDRYTVKDSWYERVLKGADSAEKCQIIIDRILDKGSYSQFDTPEEIQKLVLMLEEKKATFKAGDVSAVENPQWREEMKVARELNGFATKKLFDESQKLSQRASQECKDLGVWSYVGMATWAKFTGDENPYDQIVGKYSKFSDAVCELSNSVNELTPTEFGEKATQLLGTSNYDVKLIEKLSKNHSNYNTALVSQRISELLKFDFSEENLAKYEQIMGGVKKIEENILGYKDATNEKKFEVLKATLEQNNERLKGIIGETSASEIIANYEEDYTQFLKMVGVENINEELDSFRTTAEYVGMGTKLLFVVVATTACAMTAGGAVGLLGAAVKGSALSAGVINGTATAAGVLGAFSASSLPELYARDGELKNDIVQQYIDNPDILAHSAIDGATCGAAAGASMLIGGAVKNIGAKYLSLLFADGLIGTGVSFAHAKVDGREITGKDVALNFGIAAVTSGIAAKVGSKANVEGTSSAKSFIKEELPPYECDLSPMYKKTNRREILKQLGSEVDVEEISSAKASIKETMPPQECDLPSMHRKAGSSLEQVSSQQPLAFAQKAPVESFVQAKNGDVIVLEKGSEFIYNGKRIKYGKVNLAENKPEVISINGKKSIAFTKKGDVVEVEVFDADFRYLPPQKATADVLAASAGEVQPNKISISADPDSLKYSRLAFGTQQYVVDKSVVNALRNLEEGGTCKLVAKKNGRLVIDNSVSLINSSYSIVRENGELVLYY